MHKTIKPYKELKPLSYTSQPIQKFETNNLYKWLKLSTYTSYYVSRNSQHSLKGNN